MKKNRLILNKDEILNILGNEYTNLATIISDKFGIINALLERNELLKYDLKMYQCLSSNTKDLFGLDREVSSGGLGISSSKEKALINCIAEAIERYCMSFIPQKELKFCKLEDLTPIRTFANFYTYNNEQYNKYDSFSNPYKDKIHWTKIYAINNKRVWKYWPASLIYLPFNCSKPVAENSSTGMAAGYSIEDCIISGLLELLERDALMINFLQRLDPPEINIDSIEGCNKHLIDKIREDYDLKIYKLYTDVDIPIFLSFIWKKDRGKIHYGIGASANLDSDYAINKALKECLFTFFYSKHIMDLRKDNPEDITALYEHFLYYQGNNFEKLLFKSEVIDYVKQTTTLANLLESLKKVNIDVFYKELTTEDIEDTNLKVVKVIAPGLIDLNKTHILPRLGADRFWNVPERLKLKYKRELSKEPHPFP